MHRPEVIIEIGSDQGYNTRNLLDFCRRTGAALHAIDPLPKFDVDAWEHEYKQELTLHRLPSLEALPQLPNADVVLIDGDHNWHTVFHELKTLEDVAQLHGGAYPLVFLHDIGWPYGRRDLYYEPDRIPEPHRHPYRQAGLRPSRGDLDTTGGLNTHLYNAIEEGGPRNGVLTAIEDFLEQTTLDLNLVTVPGIHDLGIVVSAELRTENAALAQFLEELMNSRPLREVARQVETLRVAALIDLADRLKDLDAARSRIAKIQEQLDSALESFETTRHKNRLKVSQLEIRNKSLDQDRAQIHAQSKRLRSELASLKKSERQLEAKVEAEQDARRRAARQLQRLRNRRVVRTALRMASLTKPFIRLWRRARRPRTEPSQSSGGTASQAQATPAATATDIARTRSEIGTADIVVCVHNAEDDVRNCLESIVETTNLVTHGLIVVDDGSDEPVKTLLEEYASRNPVQLIRNETAQGYTVAANQGISVSERPHVVLLNSDTVVTPGWLEKLIHCAEVMPNAGIVGPYSNAASWQSLPELTNPDGSWHLNPLPDGVTPADIAAEISRWSPRIYPEVPLVNGFCYLITRSALDQVGSLDEKSFPRGYGEEDDFSIRCSDLGLKLYIADDCYVYHAKSRSHTPEGRKEIVRENKAVLQGKHGAEAVAERVDQIRLDEDLIRSRKFVSGAIASRGMPSSPAITDTPLVGWLQPHLEEAGGIRRVIEMTNRLKRWGCESVIIAPDGWKSTWLPILSDVVSVNEARSMSFDYLILSDPDILWPFMEIKATHRVVYHLAPYMVYRKDDETLQAYYESTEESLHVANSKWTAEQVEAYSGLTIQGVFPGGVDKQLFHPMRVERSHDVVCHGSNRAHKGTDTIEEATTGLNLLKMDTLGAPQRNLARLINSGQVFVSAAWHEGFNLAALEAMACGVPVVMTDDGGSREYAVDGENALVVEPRDPSALREKILELQRDKSLRASLIEGGLETVWQYSWDTVTADFADLVFTR
jgi:GT2 family glycosyltransferase